MICSFRDITQRIEMEENLRQALEKEKELNELKSRFVSMVSQRIPHTAGDHSVIPIYSNIMLSG